MAFDSYSGCDIELDISVAHPWNKDILFQAADEGGIAAAKREVSKKYSRQTDRQTDGRTDRDRDRQTDRQTDRHYSLIIYIYMCPYDFVRWRGQVAARWSEMDILNTSQFATDHPSYDWLFGQAVGGACYKVLGVL